MLHVSERAHALHSSQEEALKFPTHRRLDQSSKNAVSDLKRLPFMLSIRKDTTCFPDLATKFFVPMC